MGVVTLRCVSLGGDDCRTHDLALHPAVPLERLCRFSIHGAPDALGHFDHGHLPRLATFDLQGITCGRRSPAKQDGEGHLSNVWRQGGALGAKACQRVRRATSGGCPAGRKWRARGRSRCFLGGGTCLSRSSSVKRPFHDPRVRYCARSAPPRDGASCTMKMPRASRNARSARDPPVPALCLPKRGASFVVTTDEPWHFPARTSPTPTAGQLDNDGQT